MLNRRFFIKSFTAALTIACGSNGWAAGPATPTTLEGGKVITVSDAKALLDSKKALFIDTRSIVNFGKGHIPSAVAASYKEKSEKDVAFDAKLDTFDMKKFPKDKASPIVIYSDGPTGWKSYKASVIAVKAGYAQVHYLRGGYAEWSAQNMPIER
jgi:rhodanese-related sulfurtransferase